MKITNKQIQKIVKESISKILSKASSFNIEDVFHLSEIPIDELEEQYIDYSFDDKHNHFATTEEINENTDFKLQAKKAKQDIMRLFGLKDWQVVIRVRNYNVEVILLYAGIFKNTKIIKSEMERLGFYPSMSAYTWKKWMLWKGIVFEPYKQSDLTAQAKKYGVLYHLSPSANHNDIKQKGLVPSSKNNLYNYPNRVYVFGGDVTLANINKLGQQLYNADKKKNKYNNGKYFLYSIDIKQLPSDVIFQGDPNYGYGYFTEQPIPPECITQIQELNFKNQ